VVKVQTPYLCESASDLLSYYESLPLERRLDGLFGVLLTLELLSSANVLRRETFPRTRRCLDMYCLAVGIAGVAPQHLFYRLHYWAWAFETRKAIREVGPPMPTPASTQVGQTICQAWSSLKSGVAPCEKLSTSTTSHWAIILFVLSVGVGGFWWLGIDGAKNIWDSSCRRVRRGWAGVYDLLQKLVQVEETPSSRS